MHPRPVALRLVTACACLQLFACPSTTSGTQGPSGTLSLSAGGGFSCEVRSDHSLWCWGYNIFGQVGQGSQPQLTFDSPTRVGTDSDWAQVSAGSQTACAVKLNGTLWCWGGNSFGVAGQNGGYWFTQPTFVDAGSNWAHVSVGPSGGVQVHACGLRTDGTVGCWGGNRWGQLGDGTNNDSFSPGTVGSDTDWVEVVAASVHSCARKANGTVWCWGDNEIGMLGNPDAGVWIDGGYAGQSTPVEAVVGSDWTAIGAAYSYSCGVRADHNLWCWGNVIGGPGVRPAIIDDAGTWATVSGGVYHLCGTHTDGTIACLGNNQFGEIGDGTTGTALKFTRAGSDSDWASVSAGEYHSCALKKDGTRWCWGLNLYGELGVGDEGSKFQPVKVGSDTNWTSVTAGAAHTCATKSDHSLWCWGAGNLIGNGDVMANQEVPTLVDAGLSWSSVRANQYHSCGIDTAGGLWCWGNNPSSEVGAGGYLVPSPVQVIADGGAGTWTQVAPGASHTCAMRSDGTMWCWGSNGSGVFAMSSPSSSSTPVLSDGGTGWSSIVSGSSHMCGARPDQSLWCWGDNTYGDLGYGGYASVTGPVQEQTGSHWIDFSAGDDHTCAVRSDGKLFCWGGGSEGQLGTGSIGSESATPLAIDGGSWAKVSAGSKYTCGIQTDGSRWCWGSGSSGQLGFGSRTTTAWVYYPTRVGTDTNWSDVSTGSTHACGLRADGSLWCWGDNLFGQLGDGSEWKSSPVQVH